VHIKPGYTPCLKNAPTLPFCDTFLLQNILFIIQFLTVNFNSISLSVDNCT